MVVHKNERAQATCGYNLPALAALEKSLAPLQLVEQGEGGDAKFGHHSILKTSTL